MGNDGSKNSFKLHHLDSTKEIITKNSFNFYSVIGKGGFGKVWKVLLLKNQKQYALKEMLKVKIIEKQCVKSVLFERDLLSLNMNFAFQDKDYIYLGMDLLKGGDLRYHLSKHKTFTEAQSSLEYIHLNNVIHRDIKPENLVFDSNGYIKITDFGMAKYYHKNNSKDTSGTPGYMAPEVMWSKNHTKAVDYFALGIIGYECMKGERPYLGSRKDIKEKILSKQVQITKNDIPPGWPLEAAHFINSLLQRKPNKRLGFKGVSEIKEHSWLKYYPWRDLYLGKIESPIKPDTAENYDIHYCNKPDRIGHQTYERYIKLIGNSSYPSKFKEFYYFNRDTINERELLNKMFKNPHLLYFEELTGNTKPNDDQPVINRNILKNKVLEEEEEKKEECFQYETTDYQHAIIKKKRINILNSQKGTLFHMYNVFSNGLNTTLLNNNDNATNRISYYHKKKLGKNDLSMNGSYSFRKGHVSFKSNVFY